MCVIAERLACPHKVAHAARGGHFFWRLHIWAHTSPQMDCASTETCKTQIATTSCRETVLAARDTTYISRSPGRPQRANARMKPEVSKLATITPHMRKLLAHACETRVLPPPGAMAEHGNSSRMNWKVRFHSHGSSLMIDSNTQRQPSGTLCEPQAKSMRR